MVKWSISARQDLKQIHDYIARDSQYYAKKVAKVFIEKSEQLLVFPLAGEDEKVQQTNLEDSQLNEVTGGAIPTPVNGQITDTVTQ